MGGQNCDKNCLTDNPQTRRTHQPTKKEEKQANKNITYTLLFFFFLLDSILMDAV
jgi:hypothetical protein